MIEFFSAAQNTTSEILYCLELLQCWLEMEITDCLVLNFFRFFFFSCVSCCEPLIGPLGVKCSNFFLYLNYTGNTCTSPSWLLFTLEWYIKKMQETLMGQGVSSWKFCIICLYYWHSTRRPVRRFDSYKINSLWRETSYNGHLELVTAIFQSFSFTPCSEAPMQEVCIIPGEMIHFIENGL